MYQLFFTFQMGIKKNSKNLKDIGAKHLKLCLPLSADSSESSKAPGDPQLISLFAALNFLGTRSIGTES